jgi:hypothetical protein
VRVKGRTFKVHHSGAAHVIKQELNSRTGLRRARATALVVGQPGRAAPSLTLSPRTCSLSGTGAVESELCGRMSWDTSETRERSNPVNP